MFLHRLRGLLEFVLEFAELFKFHFAIDIGFYIVHVALEPSKEMTGRACYARQPLRPYDHERHHRDNHQFGKSDVKHLLDALQ